MDKYTKIDKERAEFLTETYGKEIVTEKTEFKLNAELVEKYSEVLSDLITKSKNISAEDKENLIETSTSWTVSKGTIENLKKLFGKFKVTALVEDIRPIFSIKSIK